jgi:hypothetical protein
MISEQELLTEINRIFSNNPEVLDFLKLHNDYVHAVDDLVDKDKNVNPLDVAEMALKYYNHPVYVKHQSALHPICYMNHNTYRDSVLWEKHEFDDKGMRKEASKALRHASIDVFMLMVLIYCGDQVLRRISPWMRAYTFEKHYGDI